MMNQLKLMLLLFAASLVTYIVKFWQLEMVWIGYATEWGYRFFWLPSTLETQGLLGELWFWRDVWWFVECGCFLTFGYSMYLLGKNGWR